MKDAAKARETGVGKLVSAGLRKQAAGTHLDAEFLAAFAENELAPAEREQALDHLSCCPDCREVLFLAQPQASEQLAVAATPRPSVALFRWVAVAASVVIVAGGVFLTRHERDELTRQTRDFAYKAPPPAGYIATDQKAATPKAAERELATRVKEPEQVNGRPEAKHMTAKPQTKMEFDSTDQVRVQNAAPAAAAEELPARGSNTFGLRDLAAAQPAPVPPAQREAVKVQPEEIPRSTNETVTVTEESPVAESQAAAEASTEAYAMQTNGAIGNSAGPVVGGLMKAPVAQWSLSRKGTLRRSFDEGRNWLKVSVVGIRSGFLAVSAVGADVWVGGKGGRLYHSADSGLTWIHVVPTADGRQLSSDIEHVEFSNAQGGKLTTTNAIWTTADGGRTWTVSNP